MKVTVMETLCVFAVVVTGFVFWTKTGPLFSDTEIESANSSRSKRSHYRSEGSVSQPPTHTHAAIRADESQTPVPPQRAATDRSDLGDRVAVAEKEISSLRAMVQRLENETDDQDSVSIELESEWVENIEHREEALEDDLNAQFDTEQVDSGWNQEAEAQIFESWGQDQKTGSNLVVLECRETTCKAVLEHEDSTAQELFLQDSVLQMPWEASMTVLAAAGDEGLQSIVFIAREGHDKAGLDQLSDF